MNLKAFLQLSCQLVDSTRARIHIEERTFEFYTSKSTWQVSSKIKTRPANAAVMGFLTSGAVTRWQLKGIHFQYRPEDQSIYITQKTDPLSNFVKFKSRIEAFIKLINEWENTVELINNPAEHCSSKTSNGLF